MPVLYIGRTVLKVKLTLFPSGPFTSCSSICYHFYQTIFSFRFGFKKIWIATRLQDGRSRARNPVDTRVLVLTGPCIHPPTFKWHWRSYRGVKRPQPEVDRTPLSSVEFKNEWSYTYNHFLHLREVCRGQWYVCRSIYVITCPPPPRWHRTKKDDRNHFKLRCKFWCQNGGMPR